MTSMRDTKNRTVLQVIVTFLFKLITGYSHECIAALLNITKKQVENEFNAVLKCFEEEVLPKNFGLSAHSIEHYLNQTSICAERLHNLNGCLALICDGTY